MRFIRKQKYILSLFLQYVRSKLFSDLPSTVGALITLLRTGRAGNKVSTRYKCYLEIMIQTDLTQQTRVSCFFVRGGLAGEENSRFDGRRTRLLRGATLLARDTRLFIRLPH